MMGFTKFLDASTQGGSVVVVHLGNTNLTWESKALLEKLNHALTHWQPGSVDQRSIVAMRVVQITHKTIDSSHDNAQCHLTTG